MKKTIRIIKGQDEYIEITPLSDYCRQRGWKVSREVVTIVMPEGQELDDLMKHIKSKRIRVVEP